MGSDFSKNWSLCTPSYPRKITKGEYLKHDCQKNPLK